MTDTQQSYLTQAEIELRNRFLEGEKGNSQFPSEGIDCTASARLDQLVLPDEMRASMPLTKDKYIVKENAHLVAWEREVRKFLRNLSPEHGHRVSAGMIYEWATGIKIVDLMERKIEKPTPTSPTWRGDLRKLNKVLAWYFGKPYTTYICGRKVGKAYRVPAGYYIRRHRPMSLTLWAEYSSGVLYP